LAAYILDKQYPAVTELQEQYSRGIPHPILSSDSQFEVPQVESVDHR